MTRLFEMILQTTAGASILVVLVLMLMFALGKKYNQKWRYWVWMFIALRLVLPFDIPHDASLFTFSIPEEKTVITYNPDNNVGTQTTPDKIIIPSDITQNIEQTPTHDTRPVVPPTTVTPPSTNDNIIIPVMPDEDVVDVTPTKTISLTQIFAVVWLVGVLGCAVWHIVMHIRFLGRAKLWNRPVTEPWANEIFNNVKKEMGITEDVKLYRNRSVHSPILTGFFKPTVLIPTRNLTENDLYMVLRHELLHYKRHDLWYKLLLVVAGCLHWFNPFVWFMVRRADRDLEIACDEAVVKGESTEFRKDYCETILRIIRCDRGRKPALSTGFTTGKKTMKKRFACALDSTAKRTGIILLCLVLCATIVCSTFIACDITKRDLTKYYDDVLYFAEWIPQTFANTTELENDFVSGYVFRTITSKNEYKEDETGAVHITQSKINEATKLLLGMETFVPDRELWMYYAESDSYAFYPVGEGPMYSGEITSSEEKDGVLYFTVKLTQKLYGSEDEEGYVPPKVYVINYAFTENDNELYPLKAIKAEYDAEYLASIDVKGIGVLGYVDNAGTLPRHSVELTEKISDANSFMFKKHRVCAYDAARNGYVVHYYDYTEGDDALNLALAVETIVKGSGLKVNTARVEKGFVVVDLLPTGEAVDNIKVKELLESIACTNDTNGYYLTGFTLSGGQFDFGDITLENDGYGKYDFEPLFNQPITELEFATMRNLLKYPFINGIPIYDGTGVAFADSVTDKNEELASLIYHTAGSGEYANFSQLSDEDKATVAISMVPDTYDCMTVPEKWSEVVVNYYDYIYLKPLMTVVNDFEFVTKEWVELAVKQLWGEDAQITHPDTAKPKWTYRREAGVYTPPHMGVGNDVLPYIHSVTKTADGYVAEVSYVLANIGGVHGWDNGETLLTYDMFDNEEVVELAKRQNKYIVTTKYGDDGKLYLVSCVREVNSTREDIHKILQNAQDVYQNEGTALQVTQENPNVVVSTANFMQVDNYLGFESYAIQDGKYEFLNVERMNLFIQNWKDGIGDSIILLGSGSPVPLYAEVLEIADTNFATIQMYFIGKYGALDTENYSEGPRQIELFETETMWLFKRQGSVEGVFPKTEIQPLPFAEERSMTTDEIAKKLESMNKYGFKVKYKGEETVLETQVYRFDYYDQETLMDYIYISKDLQKIFVIDQAHGRIHTVIK